jgi:hypothetical protein
MAKGARPRNDRAPTSAKPRLAAHTGQAPIQSMKSTTGRLCTLPWGALPRSAMALDTVKPAAAPKRISSMAERGADFLVVSSLIGRSLVAAPERGPCISSQSSRDSRTSRALLPL